MSCPRKRASINSSSSGFPVEFTPAKAGAGMTEEITWTAVIRHAGLLWKNCVRIFDISVRLGHQSRSL